MKRIYYSELADFVNLENINIKGKEIRIGSKPLNFNKYPVNHGVIQGNLNSLKDIAELEDAILEYPMGSVIEMTLFNLMLQTKGMLQESKPEQDIEIYTNMPLGGEFSIILSIQEESNVFSKIKVSNYRTFELSGKPSELTKEVAKITKSRFEMLSQLPL